MAFNFDKLGSLVSDLGDVVYDPAHPADTVGLMPFIGAPISYHSYRSGRGSWGATALSAGIGIAFTESIFYALGSRAGFTGSELFLGRAMTAFGFRYMGNSMFPGMLWTAKAPAKGLTWRLPSWAIYLAIYEGARWYIDYTQEHGEDLIFDSQPYF